MSSFPGGYICRLGCSPAVKGQLDVPRAQRTPSWEIPINKPYSTWIFMDKLSPRIPRLNTINTMVLLMAEILHHLGCMKPYK